MEAPEQLLRDPNMEPTNEIIADALGEANGAYLKFTEGLKSRDINLTYRYYTDGKAWLGKGLYRWTGARGGQNEVTAFWLSVWGDPSRAGGFFKVSIYIPEKARADALRLPVSDDIKRMIDSSNQMGKLKFFPLIFDMRSDELADEVYTLIDFKKRIK